MKKTFFLFFLFFVSITSYAHGSLEVPISRLYNCYKEGPESPKSAACKAAQQVGGKQALYDWNGLNQLAANDQHRKIILDGKLCSASRELFKGMDLARNDWPTTTISPDGNGRFDFVWNATAPHATKYFRFYITKPSYDFLQPLKWSDLENDPFCTITTVNLEHGRYKMNCPLPTGEGKRILFLIWQRNDSAEAFYACSDIVLSNKAQKTWAVLDNFYANAEVAPETKVVLRLFKGHSEINSFVAKISVGQTNADQWPYYLAQEINNKSSLIHMGQLDASGQIIPVKSATLNKVYVNDTESMYHYVIDFILPQEEIDFIYPDNIKDYTAGTIVLGFDQKRYQCKAWPASGWCSQSPVYYEPGRGYAWKEAWNLLTT